MTADIVDLETQVFIDEQKINKDTQWDELLILGQFKESQAAFNWFEKATEAIYAEQEWRVDEDN